MRIDYWDEMSPGALMAATRVILGLGLVRSVVLNLWVDDDDALAAELDALLKKWIDATTIR